MRHPVEMWLDDVWARTVLVQVLGGGEGHCPLEDRPILGWIEDPEALSELRVLSTTGSFTGDVCRCLGSLTLSLHDADGGAVGHASLHGLDTVAWDRARFGDNLEVADPVGLALLLSRYGASRWLTRSSSRLARVLGLQEGRPQFRQAGHGRAGADLLAVRQVPLALRPALARVSGQEAADLPEEQVDELRQELVRACPNPDARSLALLAWLGSLPEPMEAEFGEGVLVRRLLEGPSPLASASGWGQPLEGKVALGVMRWAGSQSQEFPLADLLGPCLRTLLG